MNNDLTTNGNPICQVCYREVEAATGRCIGDDGFTPLWIHRDCEPQDGEDDHEQQRETDGNA